MSHKEQRLWCQRVANRKPEFFYRRRVLEVGSLNINGSPRGMFHESQYLGIDWVDGHDVDRVCSIDEVNETFDTVVSWEALEHDHQWFSTLRLMRDALEPGGFMLITCAGPGRAEHGTRKCPDPGMANDTDHYQNLSPTELLWGLGPKNFRSYAVEFNGDHCDTYFWGIKK